MKPKHTVAYLCLFAAVLIWGASPIAVKDSLSAVAPAFLVFVRAGGSLLPLGLLALAEKRKYPHPCQISDTSADGKRLLFLAVVTGLFVSAGYLLQTVGLAYTTPAKSAFLENAYCLIVPPLTWLLAKKKPRLVSFACMLLCLGGVAMISADAFDGAFNTGDLLCTLAGLSFGVNIVVTGLWLKKDRMIFYTFLQMAVVTVTCGLYCLLVERSVPAPDGKTLLQMAFLSLFATTLAWIMRNRAQTELSPVTLALILPLSSVVDTVLSCLFGTDRPTAAFLGGAALLLASLFLDVAVPEKR